LLFCAGFPVDLPSLTKKEESNLISTLLKKLVLLYRGRSVHDVRKASKIPVEIRQDYYSLFDSKWYLSRYTDVAAAKIDPLRHYKEYGASERRDPHLFFDTTWYLDQFADPIQVGSDALQHFIATGAALGKSPHPLFDVAWYLTEYTDVKAGDQNPLIHYLSTGAYEGKDPNPYFDSDWYIRCYSNLLPPNACPLTHFVEVGSAMGLDPSPSFDTTFYVKTNPDIGNLNPLSHYITKGRSEGRLTKRPEVRSEIAVVFLARSQDGSTAGIELFVESYRRFAAGVKHDLIVLRKGGMRKRGAKLALDIMLEGTGVQYIDFDDTAYDIQAYLSAAALLKHEFVCFLNTHSEIMADDWLKKLYAPFAMKDVGVTGATASYESISDSIEINAKAIWLTSTDSIPYNEDLAEVLGPRLQTHAPQWMAKRGLGGISQDNDCAGLVPSATKDYDLELRYAKHWSAVTGPGGPLYSLADFKRFPNPHIRTNAFLMRRELLIDLKFDLDNSKLACLQFESGPAGLYARLEQRGLKSILVGADGRTFDVDRWIESHTFRLGDQSNIMVKDNRVRDVDNAPACERALLVNLTWGRYVGEVPEVLKKLGFPLEKGNLRVAAPAISKLAKLPKQILVSIVIPSHNRLSLVKEALVTVMGQSYPHWECIVFDNASEEPLLKHVESLKDPRIKYAQSNEFLPVTESWNRAIDLAQGDYVLLIGDDDGLVPGALDRLVALVRKYDTPDLIYSSFYQFFHPGVAPWEPSGTVVELRLGFFFSERDDDFLLSRDAARLAVKGSLELRRCFAFNMQAQFFERNFLQRIRRNGKVFHSPFPDYYIANVAMIEARSIVVVPMPLTIAGVSRKSFGFTLFNKLPERGASLLNTTLSKDEFYSKAKAYLLPGSDYNTNYIITMEHVAKALQGQIDTTPRTDRYRQLQIFFGLGEEEGLLSGKGDSEQFRSDVWPLLTDAEKQWTARLTTLSAQAKAGDKTAIAMIKELSKSVVMSASSTDALKAKSLWTGEFANLPELFAALSQNR
jgi:glycosyltransferase involved in cell wall biosynthesis